ncbi:MAG: ATP-binding protein [Cyanobacteria bacterium J06648_16]
MQGFQKNTVVRQRSLGRILRWGRQRYLAMRSYHVFQPGQRASRLHLVRYFSLTSLSVFLLMTLGLSWLYRQHSLQSLTQLVEDKNTATAKLISNAIWSDFGRFLQDSSALTPVELRQSHKTRQLRLHVLNQIQGLSITSVEIYGIQGRVVFSTNSSRIGQAELSHPPIARGLEGVISSELVLDDPSAASSPTHRYARGPSIRQTQNHLTSYVPMETNLSNQIQGVIKVQTDVTPLVGQILSSQRTILAASAGVSAVAYTVLFLLVKYADSLLRQQRRALSQAYEESEQKADDLMVALKQLKSTQAQLIQTEKMSSLGQLVAGVAHEINNPVNFIHGNLGHINQYTQDLLALVQLYGQEHAPPSPKVQALIEDIDLAFLTDDLSKLQSSMKLGTERIRDIVKSLKTFSRLDEAEMKAVDLHRGLDSTLVILNSQLKGSRDEDIQVVKRYGDLPPVMCHASQINQVFMNVLANAIDALKAQTTCANPTVTLTTERQADCVVISIADNGPGILEEIRTTIFDPFFTTKPVGKGTGLGLSISYQIVDAHGGALVCQSDVGQGTTFVITLPLQAKKTP